MSCSVVASVNWVELVTAGAVMATAVFSFCFWYVRNRPNIIVKPNLTDGVTTVVITNEGLSQAKSLEIKSPTLHVPRDSEQTLDVRVAAMYPNERYEYFVAVSLKAVKFEPYEFNVSHKRWLLPGPRVKRRFTLDFGQYEDMLQGLHVTTPFENHMKEIARIGGTLVQMQINKKDRFRLWKYKVSDRAQRLGKWLRRCWRTASRSHG